MEYLLRNGEKVISRKPNEIVVISLEVMHNFLFSHKATAGCLGKYLISFIMFLEVKIIWKQRI